LEGARIILETSGNFPEEKPEMFRSCRNRFGCFSQMKITNPELFRIALKIILVGTGNVLSPHKYFQFDRTLKNVVVNSESAFWDIFGKSLLGYFQKASRRAWGPRKPLMGGPPRVGQPRVELLHGAPHGTPFPSFSFLCVT